MKKLIVLLPILVSLSCNAATLKLEWNPPPQTTNVEAYYVWTADQVIGPWTCTGSTNGWNSTNFFISLQPCEKFFYVTASNFWGVSDHSNIARVPAVPTLPTGTVIFLSSTSSAVKPSAVVAKTTPPLPPRKKTAVPKPLRNSTRGSHGAPALLGPAF